MFISNIKIIDQPKDEGWIRIIKWAIYSRPHNFNSKTLKWKSNKSGHKISSGKVAQIEIWMDKLCSILMAVMCLFNTILKLMNKRRLNVTLINIETSNIREGSKSSNWNKWLIMTTFLPAMTMTITKTVIHKSILLINQKRQKLRQIKTKK